MNKFFVFLLFCITLQANAQNSTIKRAQESYEDAQQFLRQSAYDEGIKYLDQAIKADPKFQAAYIQLGDVYRKIRQFPKAIENYKKAILSAHVTVETRIYFVLAESELLIGNYGEAKASLLEFQSKYQGQDADFLLKTKKYLLDCDFAINAIKSPTNYEPINMGFNVNSEYRDYFPALTADGETIIFSRVVQGNEDFYTSKKKDGKWQKAEPLSSNINTPMFNEGAQSISPDGKYLFFTGCNRPDGLGRCDIYLSRKEGNKWGKAINLGTTINSEYWESQPSISPDGNTLYFVSNRPGGIGGYDIWKSTLNDESRWNLPVNLGPAINTPFDESTPFMHSDGKTLYFSSDGWPGMGNKDIFFSKLENDKWSNPQNLGYPINTFNEETGLIVSADGTEGLFSSNLEGGFGELDIYRFKLPEIAKPMPVTYVKGVVRDKETNELLEASIVVIDLKTDLALFNDITSAETGDFLTVLPIGTTYSFDVDAPGYLFYSRHYDLKEVSETNKPFEVALYLDKIKLGANAALSNIFFESNKFELLPTSMAELNLLLDFLTSNDKISIEIQGHTDSSGESKFNEKLSENRAKEVYNYLINNGIAAKRLRYKGYGSTKPRADNTTEEGRHQNRRTEFIITKI
ncbi:OmpA family protein [Pedobacter sp. Du54]|uniref:OmpA family protein n=1 Tax=Pedobacter anseongensis TaxID=3133439 RepID=UPI0030B2EC24